MLIEATIGIGAVAAGVFCRAVFMPRSRICGPVIYRGTNEPPARIALTFDDGPDPQSTPRILDVLKELNVPATFFVIGNRALQHPDIIQRIVNEGHVLGNHSFEHKTFGTLRRDQYWLNELKRTDDVIEQITGKRPAFFRPPMGFKTFHITAAAKALGHTTVVWTRRPFDGLFPMTLERIVGRLSSSTAAGDIIMMHDGIGPKRSNNLEAVLKAIPILVESWRKRGLSLVRLDELIDEPAYQTGLDE